MKKLLILLILLLAIPFAFALNPLNVIKIHNCINVSINVTALSPIDSTEYYIPYCEEKSLNQWFCNCTSELTETNDYQLQFAPKENAVNIYKLNITYWNYYFNAEVHPVATGHHISLSSRYLDSLTSTTKKITTTTSTTTTIPETTTTIQSITTTIPVYNYSQQGVSNKTNTSNMDTVDKGRKGLGLIILLIIGALMFILIIGTILYMVMRKER